MVIDFTVMKKRLAEVLEELDHRYLNDIPYFKRYNPTSEHLAKYFYDRLRKGIPGIYAVTVWESDRASATYHG
jgi:6-pyruvoyltetrahydropterin/6-carboxytetrahydropterin synthase